MPMEHGVTPRQPSDLIQQNSWFYYLQIVWKKPSLPYHVTVTVHKKAAESTATLYRKWLASRWFLIFRLVCISHDMSTAELTVNSCKGITQLWGQLGLHSFQVTEGSL